MRKIPAALLGMSALVLSSCGASLPARIFHPASVVAVTLPEDLVAGAPVTIYVHWMSDDCGDRIDPFLRWPDGPHAWKIEATASRPTEGYLCLDDLQCFPAIDTLRLRVPVTGTDHYRILGKRGSLSFDLTAGAAAGPEQRISVTYAEDGTPYVGLPVQSLDLARNVLEQTSTDSTGTAVLAAAPCGGTIVSLQNRDYPCGIGAILFNPFIMTMCGRAFHTYALYSPAYQTAGVAATAATYSGGSPWCLRPATIASR